MKPELKAMTETITADKSIDMDTYILYSEAMEEAERLKRVTGNPHTVVREDCPCDYSRHCFRCGGEGQYLVIVEQTVVSATDTPLISCRERAIESAEAEWETAQV